MQWRDGLAIVIGSIFVLWVSKSILLHVRQGAHETPLRGKLSAARDWLEENGYTIVRVRDRVEWVGYYDEKEYKKQFIADFIVRQGPKYYAVKVQNSRDKGVSGQKLRDNWYPLFVNFAVHGVLHLDVDAERAHVIDFDIHRPSYVRWRIFINRSLWFAAGMVVALAWLHG